MDNNIAIFLDLDNAVIGAAEAGYSFDVEAVIERVCAETGGRVVLRRAYGDWRSQKMLTRQLAAQGFVLQSVVPLNNSDKNLADMQMVADAVETLFEPYNFQHYVLITGDRDFIPLVQKLQQYGKQVIGCGVRHTASKHFSTLCDSFIYYDDLVEQTASLGDEIVKEWLEQASQQAFSTEDRVRASVFRNIVQKISGEQFGDYMQGRLGFGRILEKHTDIVQLYRDGTTLYVLPKGLTVNETDGLVALYKTHLKQLGYRVVTHEIRLTILHDIITYLKQNRPIPWQGLIEMLADWYEKNDKSVSKSSISYVMRAARKAGVLRLPDSRLGPLSAAHVTLGIDSFRDAVMACDQFYIREIQKGKMMFDVNQVTVALYGSTEKRNYIEYLLIDL